MKLDAIRGDICLIPFIPINIAAYHALKRAGLSVRAFCDNSSKYMGKYYDDIPCLKPEEACAAFPDATMVLSNLFSLYRNEIKAQIEKSGAKRIVMLEDILEPGDIPLADIQEDPDLFPANDIKRLANIHQYYHILPPNTHTVVDFLNLYTDRDIDRDINTLTENVDFIRVLRIFALPDTDMEEQLLNILRRLEPLRPRIGTVHIWRHPSALRPLSLPSASFWEDVASLNYDPQMLNESEAVYSKLPKGSGIPCVFNQEQIYTELFKNHRCVFVHIAKNAGTALREYLFGYTAEFFHAPALLYRNSDPAAYGAYFVFALARNPWDRLVSGYTYCRSLYESGSSHDYGYNFCGNHSFKEFVRTLDTPEGIPLLDHVMLAPQYRWVCDKNGEVIVDYIGRVEDSENSYRHIAEKLGIDTDKPIPRINSSRRNSYWDYYDDETRDIVRRVFSADIELFGYAF